MTKFNKDFKNGPYKKKSLKHFLKNNKIKKDGAQRYFSVKISGEQRNQKGRLECEKRTEMEDSQEKWCPRNQGKEVTLWGGQWCFKLT